MLPFAMRSASTSRLIVLSTRYMSSSRIIPTSLKSSQLIRTTSIQQTNFLKIATRNHQSTGTRISSDDEKSQNLLTILKGSLKTEDVIVEDISGGCGSMYHVEVTSSVFKGLNKVKQHRMVQDAIKKEVKDMHGLTVKTFPKD